MAIRSQSAACHLAMSAESRGLVVDAVQYAPPKFEAGAEGGQNGGIVAARIVRSHTD
jgi:hypothetical protein